MRTRKVVLAVLFLLAGAACATKSQNISAQYVSPLEYSGYSCDQISMELARLGRRLNEVTGAQDKKAGNDAALMTVGMVVFWPALFFLNGDSDTKQEVARLKGEYEALETSAIQKDCSFAPEMQAARKQKKEARIANEKKVRQKEPDNASPTY